MTLEQEFKKETGLDAYILNDLRGHIAIDTYVEWLEKKCNIPVVSGILPNEIDLEQLSRLLAYSDKYEISIQFWPEQTAVYIAKDGVDLKDYGGDFDFAIGRSIEYLNRVTRNYR